MTCAELVKVHTAPFRAKTAVVLHIRPGFEIERLVCPLRIVAIDIHGLRDSIDRHAEEALREQDSIGDHAVEGDLGEIEMLVSGGSRTLLDLRIDGSVIESELQQW